MLSIESSSPEETQRMAAAISVHLKAGDFIALEGDLGAGKTCFVQGLGSGLGVTQGVRSPTFVFLHQYRLPEASSSLLGAPAGPEASERPGAPGPLPGHPARFIHHFDLYRLDEGKQLEDLGYEEFFWGEDICVVEWADRFPERLPADRLEVRLTVGPHSDDQRRIDLEARGARYELLLKELGQDDDLRSRVLHGDV